MKQQWKDPRGGHLRLYHAIIDAPAWSALSAADQRAYVALRRALGATNNGDLSLPLSRSKHYGIKSPATLAKSLRALAAVGLIAITRRGGCTRGGQRLPTLYRVTDEQVHPMPVKLIEASKATDEWKAVTSIAHGRALIAAAEAAAQEQAKKKALLQNLNDTATESEAVTAKTASAIEAWRPRPLRKLKQAAGAESGQKSSGTTGLAAAGS